MILDNTITLDQEAYEDSQSQSQNAQAAGRSELFSGTENDPPPENPPPQYPDEQSDEEQGDDLNRQFRNCSRVHLNFIYLYDVPQYSL